MENQTSKALTDYANAACDRVGLAEAKPEAALYFYGELLAMRQDILRRYPAHQKMISGIHRVYVARLLGIELLTGRVFGGVSRDLILAIENEIEAA